MRLRPLNPAVHFKLCDLLKVCEVKAVHKVVVESSPAGSAPLSTTSYPQSKFDFFDDLLRQLPTARQVKRPLLVKQRPTGVKQYYLQPIVGKGSFVLFHNLILFIARPLIWPLCHGCSALFFFRHFFYNESKF